MIMKRLLEVRERYLRNPDDRFKYFTGNLDNLDTCSICNKENCLNLSWIVKEYWKSRLSIIWLQFCNECSEKYDIRIAEKKYLCRSCWEEIEQNYCGNCWYEYWEDRDIFQVHWKELVPNFLEEWKEFWKWSII